MQRERDQGRERKEGRKDKVREDRIENGWKLGRKKRKRREESQELNEKAR